MQQDDIGGPLSIRVGGRLKKELARIAQYQQNSVSAVARSRIARALGEFDHLPHVVEGRDKASQR